MFIDVDNANVSEVTDQEPGPNRNHSRLRELAVIAMTEAQASARLALAQQARARPTAQQLSLQPGDLVDVFRDPSHKE